MKLGFTSHARNLFDQMSNRYVLICGWLFTKWVSLSCYSALCRHVSPFSYLLLLNSFYFLFPSPLIKLNMYNLPSLALPSFEPNTL